MLSLAVVFMDNAAALVLGEIQVNSALGQPLSAQIAFVDLGDVDALQLKLRLAGIEDYKKLALQYPDGHKFRFQVVNEQGALRPFIRIFTSHPIEDPFVNLLVEVSSPAGKLIKAYTVLLDPSPDFSHPLAGETMAAVEQVSPSATTAFGKDGSDQTVKPVKLAVKRKQRHARKTVHAEPQLARSRMKLAMSLSISSYDPSAQTGANRDALQEELIAKEKALQDLNLQISEMQTVIKSLQEKQGITSHAASAVPGEVPYSARPVLLAVQPPATPIIWLNSVLALAALVLAGLGWGWYRKYRRMHDWQRGPFGDLNEDKPSVTEMIVKEPVHVKQEAPHVTTPGKKTPFAVPSNDTQLTQSDQLPTLSDPAMLQSEEVVLPFAEPLVEMPANTEHVPIVPPEYAILMEANRHLRAGNDKQAESELIQAIGVNPKNIFGYQALLRIYESRADAKCFAEVALQLKGTGDEAAFKEAAAMGRKLDPDNPLYL